MGADTGMAAAGVGKAATTFLGAMSEAKAIEMQASFQQAQYEFNKQLAEYKAGESIARGEEEVTRLKRQVKQMIGSQRVAMAAQGIEIESGNALDIQGDTAMMGEIDSITIRNNALREAWGYKMGALEQSMNSTFSGIAARSRATQTLITGGIKAVGQGNQAYGDYAQSQSNADKKAGSQAATSYWD